MTTIVLIVVISVITRENNHSPLVINEICSRTASLIPEHLEKQEDYIELYNTSDQELSLDGWFLSDNADNLELQSLSGITVPAKGYIVLYADDRESEESLGFHINQNGETVFLSNSEGKIVNQIYVPALAMNTVYARSSDGGRKWAVLEATPGNSNDLASEAKHITLKAPKLSHASGFFEEEFVLTMRAERGKKIYYTTDGSVPTKESHLYEEGILIKNNTEQENVINAVRNIVADWKDYHVSSELADKACVIRAIAMDDNNHISEVVTAIYFVGLDQYKDSNVVSVTTDPEELIGEDGIFITGSVYDEWYLNSSMSEDDEFERGWTDNYELANFWKRGRRYEVLGNVQILEKGKEALNQEIGIRTQGAYNRTEDKKSMQLFSRKVYSGNSLFDRPVFDESNSHAIYVSGFPDKAYLMKLAEERNLGTQQAKSCEVFLNGEHWYHGVLMEKYDETYFSEHYGVNADNILFVKDSEATIGEDYVYLYDEMIEFLKDETISQEKKVEYLYEACDIQSLIDWLCFNLYIGNDDVSYKRNSTLWRVIEPENSIYGDCKWRWMVYDLDHAASEMARENSDFRSFMLINSNRFYLALRSDEDFCRQFVMTAMDMMNSIFLLENVEAVLNEWGEDISYQSNYFLERPEYMKKSLVNEFGLSGIEGQLILDINDTEAGTISVNTLTPDLVEGAWSGQYFIDYPVTVTATANPGYRFVGWIGDFEGYEETMDVTVKEEGMYLQAVFEKE